MVHPSPAGTVLGTLPQPEDVARLNLPVIQEPSDGPETARAANVLAKADERIAVPEGMLPSQPATRKARGQIQVKLVHLCWERACRQSLQSL